MKTILNIKQQEKQAGLRFKALDTKIKQFATSDLNYQNIKF